MTTAAPAAPLSAAWLRRLRERFDQPPATARAPLMLVALDRPAPAATIGSIEAPLALRIAARGLLLRDADGAGWCIDVPHAHACDAALAGIAQWLQANGLASAWRGELLPVTDAAGSTVGAIERAAVRPLGIATHAVHLVVADARGRVWVQQRAFDKATDPGRWDTTMGGLVAHGEALAQTLARETWEEAGLRIDDLRGVAGFGGITVRRPVAEGYMVEHIAMYEATLADGSPPLNQDGEVAGFECLERGALIERLQADLFTLEAAMILALWLARR